MKTLKPQIASSVQWDGNKILRPNEIGLESDTGNYKIGDGQSDFGSLPYMNDKFIQYTLPGFAITQLVANEWLRFKTFTTVQLINTSTGQVDINNVSLSMYSYALIAPYDMILEKTILRTNGVDVSMALVIADGIANPEIVYENDFSSTGLLSSNVESLLIPKGKYIHLFMKRRTSVATCYNYLTLNFRKK